MWTFNSDYNKWVTTSDVIIKSNFDYLKQELSSTRFYSKCLSGATYLPVNRLDNIYDILGQYQPRNWFVSTLGSQYSDTLIPSNYSSPITDLTYTDYNKYLSEYGLTLKNLFTPDRLIKDSIKNFIYVDVATTMQIDNITATFDNLTIDGVRLINGHRLLPILKVIIRLYKIMVLLLSIVTIIQKMVFIYLITINLQKLMNYHYMMTVLDIVFLLN